MQNLLTMRHVPRGLSAPARRVWIAALLMGGLVSAIAAAQAPVADQAYAREISQWRSEREGALKTDDGWLTLVGLFWLQEGTTCAGTDRACRVSLAAGSAPPRIGDFVSASGTITFKPAPKVDVRINGKPASVQVLSTQPGRYWVAMRESALLVPAGCSTVLEKPVPASTAHARQQDQQDDERERRGASDGVRLERAETRGPCPGYQQPGASGFSRRALVSDRAVLPRDGPLRRSSKADVDHDCERAR